ncbi:MAG: hypothetical protein KAT68_15180 [Bacteroidales bacterium]|nr:hypothetical protein [Bacteroidales bacterium]
MFIIKKIINTKNKPINRDKIKLTGENNIEIVIRNNKSPMPNNRLKILVNFHVFNEK